LVAASVFRDRQKILGAIEARLPRKIVGHVTHPNRFDGIDDDGSAVHRITAADFHARLRPDPHAAPDPAAPNALTKVFGKQHDPMPRFYASYCFAAGISSGETWSVGWMKCVMSGLSCVADA
jgi:uncharacterized membrane protein